MHELQQTVARLEHGHPAAALAHARRALALLPNNADAAFLKALAVQQSGRRPETAYRRVLALVADHLPATINLAGWLGGEGRAAIAAVHLRRATVLAPDAPQALGNLALVLRGAEPGGTTQRRLRRVLALLPGDPTTLLNLGDAQGATGAIDAAIDTMRQAIGAAPGLAPAHHGLALLLRRLPPDRRIAAEASAASWRALVLEPGFAAAWAARASSQDCEAAEAMLQLGRALAIDPAERTALGTLANLWRQQGRLGPAHRLRRVLVALDPGAPQGLNNLGLSALDRGEVPQATRTLRRAHAADPSHLAIHSNLLFCLAYDPALSSADMFAEYLRWSARHAAVPRRLVRPHANAPDPERRLRVGYLSADLRDHAIAWLVDGLFAAHDPRQVEIACYAEVARPDAMTDLLRRSAALWRSTVGLADEAAAQMIRDDGIDILVVLAGHTAGNRMRIAAYKPAPVQINMHNLSTSGLESVDHWLTDGALHPQDAEEGRTERLLRLPSLYLHHLPAGAPDPGPLPAQTAGHVTFGSFSNPAKLNPDVLALWAGILRDVPTARLALGYQAAFSDSSIRAAFLDRFATLGVASRVDFLGDEPQRARHLARVAQLDIALDPFPFNGGITTFEALWMGVPVVTLAGRRFAGRCGVTHLTQTGLPELIAATPEDYRHIAVRLAGDLQRLDGLRQGLRQRVRDSRLADPQRYARTVEECYRTAWRAWCARQAPSAGA